MRKTTKIAGFLLCCLMLSSYGFGGPIVTVTSDATTLVNALLGSGITISGTPTLTAVSGQAGTFTNAPSLVGFSSGIILSSGLASDASGNYVAANLPSTDLGGPGDAQLTTLTGASETFDAAVLTFNFIPTSSTVFFQYTFASAEYPNFVASEFNDAFAFFVNGTNYAVIPGTNTPVSINTVNATTNSAYFNRYNGAGDQLPYGGETVVLTFSAPVNPNVVNTMRIGITDASDAILDSAVFIQAGSLTTQPSAVPEPATLTLLGSGMLALFGLGLYRRKNRK